MLRLLLIAVGLLVVSWALLVLLAARLPDGTLKELANREPGRKRLTTAVQDLKLDARLSFRAAG